MQKRSWYWGSLIMGLLLIVGISVSQALQTPASNDSFPHKAITIVVTFPPGGGTDLLARQLGAELEQYWQYPVVIENRPGASGVVGARHVAKSVPDGHTLLMVNSSYAINPSVFDDLGFDPQADLRGVMNVAWVPSVIVTAENSPLHHLDELALNQALSFASCGNGTPQHLAGELLQQKTALPLLHVPYRGCGPAISDVMTGQVDLGIVTVSSAMALIEAGHLKPLAVTSNERSPVLPTVPTIQELKQVEFDLNQWHGLLVPSAVPAERLAQIHAGLSHVMQMQKIQDKLETLGYTFSRSAADEFDRIIATDLQRFAQLIRQATRQVD